MPKIEVNSNEWVSILDEIQLKFADGSLISHDFLKMKFGTQIPKFSDYETVDQFVKAIDVQRFQYLDMVDLLRDRLLKDRKIYIINVLGEGYIVIQPQDQVKYAYESFFKKVRKLIGETTLIMKNVRQVSLEQQSTDNTIKAKYNALKNMIKTAK